MLNEAANQIQQTGKKLSSSCDFCHQLSDIRELTFVKQTINHSNTLSDDK
jgi:hypothetical protein